MSLNVRRPPLEDWSKNRKYGVIIDAGSSGSRVYVYSWKDHEYAKKAFTADELKNKISTVERADYNGLKWTSREEPGISTFGSKPSEVGEHLDVLLNFAKEVVPENSHGSTPIFLMATAGMRLLPEEQQNELLRSTCRHIKSHSQFFMSNCEEHVKIISGELEGVYGWVAINYLMGGFDGSIKTHVDQDSLEQHHTFGFLDMGGASAQIAFEPEHHQKEEHQNDLTKVQLRTLDGRSVEYDVFVTTFLGYGSNEARRRYLEKRIEDMFVENNHTLNEHHQLQLDDPCLPLNLNTTDVSTSVPLSLHGTGNFEECIRLTDPLLNKNAACPTKPCLFNGVHTPNIDWSVNKFVGISEYWYSSHDVLGLGGVYDFTEYEEKANNYCSKDWSSIALDHKDLDTAELHRYQLQCFKSAWIVNILHEGIRIPRLKNPSGHNLTEDTDLLEQVIESVDSKNWRPVFQSIDTINDIQVSWTLGAMLLYVANQIPLEAHNDGFLGHNTDDEGIHEIADGISDHYIDSENGRFSKVEAKSTALIGVFSFILLGFLILLLLRFRKRKFNMNSTGGILGIDPSTSHRSASLLSTIRTVMSRALYTIGQWRFGSYTAVNTNNVELGSLEDPQHSDVVTINIPNGDRLLGQSFKTPSVISKQYWSKKRYSGDSYNTLFPEKGLGEASPFRTASSLGLANRNNSSSNLASRTGSTPNLPGLVDRSPSPLEMMRSRSRMALAIHEQPDEDDPSHDLTENGPTTLWTQSGSRIASPRGSPRGSLDERRK
ncbi:nucleoside phosphatase family-domain-containing protein [Sporodiniella umbellata]|nr:nucleoside phosphatase family-domain-containing protein [Sporodiniella umbellata]